MLPLASGGNSYFHRLKPGSVSSSGFSSALYETLQNFATGLSGLSSSLAVFTDRRGGGQRSSWRTVKTQGVKTMEMKGRRQAKCENKITTIHLIFWFSEMKWWWNGERTDTGSTSASNNEAHYKGSLDYNSNIWIHKWIYGHIPVSSAWRYIIHRFPLFPDIQAGISLYFN